jgi:ATP-dependent DNA helicase RecG
LWNKQENSIHFPDNLIPLIKSLCILHAKIPSENWSNEKRELARNSLAFYEFFLEQIKHKLRRKRLHQTTPIKIVISDTEENKIIKCFPYTLTLDQKRCIQEIRNDISAHAPMMRMIQGDVGCGKTTVAFVCAFATVLQGHQAAMMAPTESLAFQHYKNALKIGQDLNKNVALL